MTASRKSDILTTSLSHLYNTRVQKAGVLAGKQWDGAAYIILEWVGRMASDK